MLYCIIQLSWSVTIHLVHYVHQLQFFKNVLGVSIPFSHELDMIEDFYLQFQCIKNYGETTLLFQTTKIIQTCVINFIL